VLGVKTRLFLMWLLPLSQVLDLHSNKLTAIGNLGHLRELRVLNLAGLPSCSLSLSLCHLLSLGCALSPSPLRPPPLFSSLLCPPCALSAPFLSLLSSTLLIIPYFLLHPPSLFILSPSSLLSCAVSLCPGLSLSALSSSYLCLVSLLGLPSFTLQAST
jgi:hypothetical protein